ncbi:MAG TPA: PTS sugar transporter subunit IIB [Candidatus Eisenbacteria bacterium]|nr:PTS sugar transporter subunit IIB [Candidatus Eisenbacteria bacterium]
MPLLLARIDDRLIHGQVAYGWGRALKPTFYLVVSDALRADALRAEVCLCGVPDDARGRVVSVAEALTPSVQSEIESERTILLMPGTDEAVRLLEGGFPLTELNVGGLHHAPGKREVLPYVFLDDADKERLRAVLGRGVRVAARDLPANPSHPIESWLDAPSRGSER